MRMFVKTLVVVLCVGAGFMAGMLVDGSDFLARFVEGRLYALYVLIYTGGAFMGGLWFGQRWERNWEDRQETSENEAVLPSSPKELESSGESRSRERSELRG
jgi:hypothetical protein